MRNLSGLEMVGQMPCLAPDEEGRACTGRLLINLELSEKASRNKDKLLCIFQCNSCESFEAYDASEMRSVDTSWTMDEWVEQLKSANFIPYELAINLVGGEGTWQG